MRRRRSSSLACGVCTLNGRMERSSALEAGDESATRPHARAATREVQRRRYMLGSLQVGGVHKLNSRRMPAAWKRNARSPAIAMRCRTTRPRLKRARVSMGLVPEVGFGAVRSPGAVEGREHRVMAEHPVADLVLDEDLLLVSEIDHRSLQNLSMG